MPRKKTKAATRAKPVLPDGDEGKYLSHQEKLNKLDAYLKDLENKGIPYSITVKYTRKLYLFTLHWHLFHITTHGYIPTTTINMNQA
jgi:hypothetical protein